jgi:hypothetical protein
MKEIKYTILFCVFVRTFVIPFYYGSGTVISYGTVPVPTFWQVTVPFPVPFHRAKSFFFLRFGGRMPLFFLFIFHIYNIHPFIQSHLYNTFIHHHSPRPLSISSSLVCSVGNTSLWCQAENRTRACLTASQRATKSYGSYDSGFGSGSGSTTLIELLFLRLVSGPAATSPSAWQRLSGRLWRIGAWCWRPPPSHPSRQTKLTLNCTFLDWWAAPGWPLLQRGRGWAAGRGG